MKYRLIRSLAEDMNIYSFKSEADFEYNQRLVYSAGAAWAKTLVYGHSYVDDKNNENYINTDIMYVETHLSKVLEAFLNCFDLNADWIKEDGTGDVDEKARLLAGQIVRDVLDTYNLAKIHSRRLSPLPTQYFKYGEDLYLVRGQRQFDKITYSVGVAQWVKDVDLREHEVCKKIVEVKGKDYYQVMESEFTWKKADLPSEYLIFATGSKGGYSKCWKRVVLEKLPPGISVLKLADDYNGGYIMVKSNSNGLQMAELDPWYINQLEIYRILYALNYKNNTPAEFPVRQRDDHYILRYSSALPIYEDRIIKCCSWPYRTYDNKYFRIVPEFLWHIVESTIVDLGIKLVYQ